MRINGVGRPPTGVIWSASTDAPNDKVVLRLLKSRASSTFAPSDWKSNSFDTLPPNVIFHSGVSAVFQFMLKATRVSRKVSSSGVSPGAVVYVPLPDGRVNVCGNDDGIAPLADAPVNVSSTSFRSR